MLKGVKYPAEPLTTNEVKALMRVCGRGRTAVRNRALIAVLSRAGLRISEALALQPKDVGQDGTIRVLHGKGDRSRVVAIDPGTAAILQLWLDRRPTSNYIFCTLRGERVKASYVRGLLPRLGKRAGIAKRVHAHGLRHGMAVDLLREGVSMDVISGALGHSSLATTAVYLQHLAAEQLKDKPAFDMQAFLEQHGIVAEKKAGKADGEYDGGVVWELEKCPFADHEKDFKACVFVRRGTACFKCHADKCGGKGWKDFCKVLGADNPNAKKSLAVQLVSDALKRDKFFNDSQGRLYAMFLHNGHEETTLFDDTYRSFLRSRYVVESGYQKVLEDKPLNTAFQNLRSLAQFDSETHEVNIRTAERDGRIYIDLADIERRVLEVTKDGRNVVGCPNGLHFHRGKTTAALPVPVRGGDIDLLRKYVHVTEDDFPVVPALAAAMLLPGRRLCPPAVLVGESGNGKSTVAKVLQRLVDPKHKDQLTGQPKSIHDQLIASQHSWLLSLNNLSKMDQQLSDLLCGLTDGTGFTGRSLYTDSGEFSIVARRPIVITSIKDVVTAPDLLDRSLVIEIPMFEGAAKAETDFWNEFEQDYPAILGALLDGMVAGLRGDGGEVPHVRMLDFVRFASSAAPVWGFTSKTMQDTYVRLQQGPARKNIEESEIGRKILRYVAEHGSLSGKAAELVTKLSWDDKAPKPNEFGRQTREIAPDLKKLGVAVSKKTVKGNNAWAFASTPMLVAFDNTMNPIAELERLAPWLGMLGIRVVIDGDRATIGVD